MKSFLMQFLVTAGLLILINCATALEERRPLTYNNKLYLNYKGKNIVAELTEIPKYSVIAAKKTPSICVELECKGEGSDKVCEFNEKNRFFGLPVHYLPDDTSKPLRADFSNPIASVTEAAKTKADYALIELLGDKADGLIRPRYFITTSYEKIGERDFKSKACVVATGMGYFYTMATATEAAKGKKEKELDLKLEIKGVLPSN
ncbi:MAG: hypothetical protein KBF99_17490 [Leptospiraceae bacterium]|nr:hypothetical protein [Leptospiraceae bacterium]